MALNPVRAGACERPEDWRWSSYAAILGLVPKPDYLTIETVLNLFSKDVSEARRRLLKVVDEGLDASLSDVA